MNNIETNKLLCADGTKIDISNLRSSKRDDYHVARINILNYLRDSIIANGHHPRGFSCDYLKNLVSHGKNYFYLDYYGYDQNGRFIVDAKGFGGWGNDKRSLIFRLSGDKIDIYDTTSYNRCYVFNDNHFYRTSQRDYIEESDSVNCLGKFKFLDNLKYLPDNTLNLNDLKKKCKVESEDVKNTIFDIGKDNGLSYFSAEGVARRLNTLFEKFPFFLKAEVTDHTNKKDWHNSYDGPTRTESTDAMIVVKDSKSGRKLPLSLHLYDNGIGCYDLNLSYDKADLIKSDGRHHSVSSEFVKLLNETISKGKLQCMDSGKIVDYDPSTIILAPLTGEQWKVMSELGYPYAPGYIKANDSASIPEMIYWRLAAGFISHEDAVRAFSTTGYTVGENSQRTREMLSELNSQYGKLDVNLKPLTNKSQAEDKKPFVKDNNLEDIMKVTEKSNIHSEKSDDDVSKVGFFKSESGKNAGKYILYWEDDKGKNHRVYNLLDRKERFIVSAFFKAVKEGRREEFLNDLVSKLTRAQEKEVKKDEGASKTNMIEVRSDIPESDVRQAERAAVTAVYTRITDSRAKRFTDDQISDIRQYRAMFTDDTSTTELFSRLFEKAMQWISRCPEKWSRDAFKELNDLANGITRDQSRGLHI